MKELKFRSKRMRSMKKFRVIRTKHALYRFFKYGIKHPKAEVVLDLTYPPGFLLREGYINLLEGCSKHFNLHGLQEPWKLPPAAQNPLLKGKSKKFVDNLPVDNQIFERFKAAVLQLSPTSWDPLSLIRCQLSKHGPHLPFIAGPDHFAEFCMTLLDRYRVPELADFIIEQAARMGVGVPLDFHNLSWVGVTVDDLRRLCNSFNPINAKCGQINLELYRDCQSGLLFLYAICMALTRDGFPAERPRRRPQVKLKDHRKGTVVPKKSIVYLLPR